MPDLLTHLATGYLLASRVFKPKYAVLASILALLPDIDVLLGFHRCYTHSISVVLAVTVPVVVYVVHFKPGYKLKTLVLATIVLSHIILDLFTDYTPILWPFSERYYMVHVSVKGLLIEGVLAEFKPTLVVDSKHVTLSPPAELEGSLISETGVLVALVVALAVIVEYLSRKPAAVKK